MGNKKIYAARKQLYMTPETDEGLDFLSKAFGNLSRSRIVRQLVADEVERTIKRGRRAETRRRVNAR